MSIKNTRIRMNYKVSELHHLFFNQALPNGAKAGTHAIYDNGALYHEQAQPAAAFLNDARGHDGRAAAVIFPRVDNCRWTTSELKQAAPGNVLAIELESWTGAGKYTDDARSFLYCDHRVPGSRRYQSAAAIVAAYTAAIGYDCKRAAHSAQDSAGERPHKVPHYVAACRALLALDWNDKAAREHARAELEKVLSRWQLGPAGEYDFGIVSAISQREKVTQAAADALPRVKKYFTERAELFSNKTPAGYRARVRFFNGPADRLNDSIRDILRADLPAALLVGLPENIAGQLMADSTRGKRAAEYLSAPAYVKHYWETGRLNVDRRLLPLWARQEIERAQEIKANKRRRADVLETLKHARSVITALNDGAPIIMAAGASIAAGAPDPAALKAAGELRTFSAFRNAAQSAAAINKAAEISGGRDPLYRWPLAESWETVRDTARAVEAAGNEYREREKWNEKVTDKRAELAELIEDSKTKPRQAAAALDYMRMQVTGYGYYWSNAPENLRQEISAEIIAALDNARALIDTVPELVEYENGGNCPAGDWLLIKNGTATTSRGARVPARAIKAALAFIDRQAAGAFDCSADKIMLGAFQLIGRRDDGTIVVGCHYFSAASVEHIRAQLNRAGAEAEAA